MSATSNAFGNGTTKNNTSGTSAPWTPQQPYLTNGFSSAGSALSAAQGYANSAGTNANAWAVNAGIPLANNMASTSNLLTNNAGAMTGNAGSLFGAGMSDPTGALIGDAGQVMHSAPIQGAINNTNALIQQQLNEQTLPGLNRQAAMGGDLNSSRAGAANAMAQEGAALAEGNADSSILNNAFNTGLQSAGTQRIAGLNTALGANQQLETGINSGVLAGNVAGQLAQGNVGLQNAGGALGQNAVSNYMAEVGNPMYGSEQTGNGVQQQPGSLVGGIAGLGAGLGSLFAQGGAFGPNGSFSGVGSALGNLGSGAVNWLGGLFGGGGSGLGNIVGDGTGALDPSNLSAAANATNLGGIGSLLDWNF